MACNCIENIDQMLKERQDGRLEISIVFPRPAPGQKSPPAYTVPNLRILRRDTGKAETRSKFFRAMSPTFCPFCGTHYETREEPAVADTKRVILSGHVRTDAVGSECEFEETFSVPASLAGAALDEHLAGEARELALERVEWSYAVKNAEEKTDET